MRPIGDGLRMKTMTTVLSAYRSACWTYSSVFDNMAIYATATKASSLRSWADLSVMLDMAEVWSSKFSFDLTPSTDHFDYTAV